MQKWLISTDLDGTLLNHHSYDVEAARPLLSRLKQAGISVILNSSKTLAEIAHWRENLKLNLPIICENGGVIHSDHSQILGVERTELCDFLNTWRTQNGHLFEGFADWSIAEIQRHTGLSASQAQQAQQRQVSEPIQWIGDSDALHRLHSQLQQRGWQLLKGGRFYHVMGAHNKATGLRALFELYPKLQAQQLLALGDGENDRAMLEMAHCAVVMPNAHGQYLKLTPSQQQIIHAERAAPQGWVDAVQSIIFEETL